ncbi:MAG: hypothetical protein DLM62_18685 [Pseudonocardiales bacterium]|nr:MAG: hypothetical protein DLM62_18685 [Pseudonocardiales bacterium]
MTEAVAYGATKFARVLPGLAQLAVDHWLGEAMVGPLIHRSRLPNFVLGPFTEVAGSLRVATKITGFDGPLRRVSCP